MNDSVDFEKYDCSIFLVIDLEKNETKIVKKNSFVKFSNEIESCSDKICISFQAKNKYIQDPNEEYDLKSDNIGNDLPGQEKDLDSYNNHIVFDQNLEELNRIKDGTKHLVGSSESSLIFIRNQSILSYFKVQNRLRSKNIGRSYFIYNWSLQLLRKIREESFIEQPIFNIYYGHFFNRIYYLSGVKRNVEHNNFYQLKVFDDITCKNLKTLNFTSEIFHNSSFDCNNNMISYVENNTGLVELKYYNFNGDLYLKSKLHNFDSNYLYLTKKNRNVTFFDKDNYILYYQKKLDETNYTVKSEF